MYLFYWRNGQWFGPLIFWLPESQYGTWRDVEGYVEGYVEGHPGEGFSHWKPFVVQWSILRSVSEVLLFHGIPKFLHLPSLQWMRLYWESERPKWAKECGLAKRFGSPSSLSGFLFARTSFHLAGACVCAFSHHPDRGRSAFRKPRLRHTMSYIMLEWEVTSLLPNQHVFHIEWSHENWQNYVMLAAG